MIEKLKLLVNESNVKEENGIQLDSQSMVNYIEKTLELNVVSVEKIEDELSIYDVYKILAKSEDIQYTFIGKYYNFNEFNPRENKLSLKEISGPDGVYKTDEIFYLTNDTISKKGKDLLNTPLKDLIAGVNLDSELEFALSFLQERLSILSGYKLIRSSPSSSESFSMNVQGVKITTGFTNTFQVEFENSPLQFVQIIFRKLETAEVEKKINLLCDLIEGYVLDSDDSSDNIVLDGHSISHLMDSLWTKIQGKINTSLLIDDFKGEKGLLVHEFIVGEYSSYKQFEVRIYYDFEDKVFVINVNYLFNDEETTCKSVDDLIELIGELECLVK